MLDSLATANAAVASFFFSSRRRHTSCLSDWSSDVCSSDLSHGDVLSHQADKKLADNVIDMAAARRKKEAAMQAQQPQPLHQVHQERMAATGNGYQPVMMSGKHPSGQPETGRVGVVGSRSTQGAASRLGVSDKTRQVEVNGTKRQ